MNKGNSVLFVSSVLSDKVFEHVHSSSSDKSGQAIQKFNKLIVTGLANQKVNSVEVFSSIPVTPSINKKRLWFLKSDYIENIKISYAFTINIPVVRNVVVFFHAFFMVLFWKIKQTNTNRIVICDILCRTAVTGAWLSCKIRKIKIVGIITDMPGLDVFKITLKKILAKYLAEYFINKYDAYILITKQMNNIVNKQLKPSLIMEGLVDVNMAMQINHVEEKDKERIILYSGGIYEKYGIKNLIEAFMQLDHGNIFLDIYGTGEMKDEMILYMNQDQRIRYFGIVANEIIVKKQQMATLLVNPRPSKEEYTKYSFPSKNMEYMASGTPVVTTKLPGMPDEYIPYVYLFSDETINGLIAKLSELLNKSNSELHSFGLKAKTYVMQNKNNLVQGKRITDFIDKVHRHT